MTRIQIKKLDTDNNCIQAVDPVLEKSQFQDFTKKENTQVIL